MTMGEESPVVNMTLPVVIHPILAQLEKKDLAAAQTLRNAFTKVESCHPGFTYDWVAGVCRKADLPVNMNESVLRMDGTGAAAAGYGNDEFILQRSESVFKELNHRSTNLKKILSRIPDEINDRKTFLETIKDIASAIKKLLDAVNAVFTYIPDAAGKQVLEQRKRDFVKYSKKFSNTLKDFFKEGVADSVYRSANCLINQTNLIMSTVKAKCEV